jgi:hypothetical protein
LISDERLKNSIITAMLLSLLFLLIITYQSPSVFGRPSDEFTVRIWLADVKPDSTDVKLCVDIIDTGASARDLMLP